MKVSMRFFTLRSTVAPSLLLVAAGCGSVQGTEPDGGTQDGNGSAEPDAPPAGFPINATTAGTVDEDGTLSLAGKLVTADMDNTPNQLTYTVRSLPADGSLRVDGTPVAVGATFTQQDVNDNKVTYVHNGAENSADGFAWDLSDGEHTIPASGTINFAITVTPVNDAPTIVNNPLTSLAEGNSEVLTTARLMAADAEGSVLTYTLLAQTRGAVQTKVGGVFTNLAINGTFTQQDVADGNVRFIDPGTDDANLAAQANSAASFSWRVTDADGGVNPAVGSNITNFTITPVDDAVSITWDADDCVRDVSSFPTMTFNGNPITAIADPDTPLSQYQICIVAFVLGECIDTSSSEFGCAVSLRSGSTNLVATSCVAASASTNVRATLAYPVTSGGNVPKVTWRLMKNGAQVGATHTISHPSSPTCNNP
ncbi:MAG: cadherin-like domain-containing protein [Kofleriaceae bacterium]